MMRQNNTSHNRGLAKDAVLCSANTFVQDVSSVRRIKFSANTPRHRKSTKR
jgi:hypothetical protein